MITIDKKAEMKGRNGQTYGELMESLVMSDTDNDPNSFEGKCIQRAMLCFAESCLVSKSKDDIKDS